MTDIHFHATERLNTGAKRVIRAALDQVYGVGSQVNFTPSEPGKRVVSFGPAEVGIVTLSPKQMLTYPNAVGYVASAFLRLEDAAPRVPQGYDPNKVLYLDIETHNAGKQWDMPIEKFFRLGQMAWGPTSEVVLTTNLDTVLSAITAADLVVAHNGHSFDFSVLLGDNALTLAHQRKLFDTMVFAALAVPAPYSYTTRAGHTYYDASKPGTAMKWLGLDNLSFQLGLDGKEGDLKELAKKYNPKGTPVSELDFSLIPLDDPDFLAYARQDIKSLQELTTELLRIHTPTEYDWREQLNAAIDAQNTRNGFRVDIPKATTRVQELTARKEAILADLQQQYGLPVEGKSPWATNAGKQAIMKALADKGITPETVPTWTKTATGNISLGGQVLLEITQGTEAEDLGQALAELKGQRSLAQLALDSVHSDGKVHPDITALQRSGRKSTTRPGLTVWSSRGGKAVEKSYFIPDPGCKLVEFDYSQADARIVAAYSGDAAFAERFAEGVDAHELTGRLVFGDEVYDSDPYKYRQVAKALGHAFSYRAGAKKLAATAKQPLHIAEQFVRAMTDAYPLVTAWQNKVTAEGESGTVVNDWGRRMVVDRDRAFTQSSALFGQSGCREIVVDSLIRILDTEPRIIGYLKAQVHDALVFSIPVENLDHDIKIIRDCMEVNWSPSRGGQVVRFPVGVGNPGDDWMEASH